jgi:lipopolysaccharide transport system ATP-binding protein
MSNTVIRVENLGKKYIIGHQKQERYTALRDVVTDRVKSFASVFNPKAHKDDPTHEEFWALKDVSFEIKQGDRVGIIGRNGAGKSTLLKILSRITEPTTGKISINGRVASLLEVGTGFHPELTGRENIFLNGAILGMDRFEIKRKFDEIVAFAEVEKFLDTPVKRYSSGMYVRLAFAVAAHLEPEILVVDEVLAVGDAQFQKKCLGKMEDVSKSGRTILFVSHNFSVIETLCERSILLKQGSVLADTFSREAITIYLNALSKSAVHDLSIRTDRRGKGEVKLSHVEISTSREYSSSTLVIGRPAYFTFHLTKAVSGLSCKFTIYDQQGKPVSHFSSKTHFHLEDDDNLNFKTKLICEVDELLLVPDRYMINVAIYTNNELQDHVEAASIFDVEVGQLRGHPIIYLAGFGSVCIPHNWYFSN